MNLAAAEENSKVILEKEAELQQLQQSLQKAREETEIAAEHAKSLQLALTEKEAA